jgi:predicted RNA binding protein with dsRBD fold (UPF0201 family)
MKTLDVSCKIEAYCPIYPSEDPKKVEQAITNILSGVGIKITQEAIRGTSTHLESLQKIYETIHSHKTQNTYRRQLNLNLDNESTWFYLNKQAAFANTISICSESDESPLGPIKITLDSKNIGQILEWLIATE